MVCHLVNHRPDDYSIEYSVDGWATRNVVALTHGSNVLRIRVACVTEVSFLTQTFVPMQEMAGNTDPRELGVRFDSILLKGRDGESEMAMGDIEPELRIDDILDYLTLGKGWHEKEDWGGRWTEPECQFFIKALPQKEFARLLLHVFSPLKQTVSFQGTEGPKLEFALDAGDAVISLEFQDLSKVTLRCTPFLPGGQDARRLGLLIRRFQFVTGNRTKALPAESLLFETEAEQVESFTSKFVHLGKRQLSEVGPFGECVVANLTDHQGGKLNMNHQPLFYSHRSGWAFAMDSIMGCHHGASKVRFHGFLEHQFIWRYQVLVGTGELPLREDWVGFIHNPYDFPKEFNEVITTAELLELPVVRESLKCCRGLFALSEDFARKIRRHVDPSIPINVVYHPTEVPEARFSPEHFMANREKKILEVGTWLRRATSLYRLQADEELWNKVRILSGGPANVRKRELRTAHERESEKSLLTPEMEASVTLIQPLPDLEYDAMLTCNIVFLDLQAAVANNAIIECISRATPVLVNRLESAAEYLGNDYPLFYDNLEEAAAKVNDVTNVLAAHQYLLEFPEKKRVHVETFVHDFTSSEIYRSL